MLRLNLVGIFILRWQLYFSDDVQSFARDTVVVVVAGGSVVVVAGGSVVVVVVVGS